MSKLNLKCHVCKKQKSEKIWQPLESIFLFTDLTTKQLNMWSILVCPKCQSRIMLMIRSDGEVFEGCESTKELINLVRKEIKL